MSARQPLSLEEALPIFAPYVSLINHLIDEAIQWYKDKPAAYRLFDSIRTRSSSISDRILWNIAHCKELRDDPNIGIKVRYGSVRILVRGTIQFIFKKFNNNLMPSCAATQRSLNFRFHQDDVTQEFPEFKDQITTVTNAYWGYVWNPITCPRTPIVCIDGSQLKWQFEIVTEPAELIRHTSSGSEQRNEPRKRITPRHQRHKEREKRDDSNEQGV
jgi:hypothetical protein